MIPSALVRAAALGILAAVLSVVVPTASADVGGRPVPPELLQKALSEGPVRVIVELGAVNVEPERRLLSKAAITAQRGRIASERNLLRTALRGLSHRVLREFKTIPYVGLEVDHDALRLLDALPGLVTRVYESKYYRPTLGQSGPLVNAPAAWSGGWDGNGQVIAILDTGVDKKHPFLKGKVVSEACYDSGLSTCPNGQNADTSPGAGVPCTFASECLHGTHVAGIAAGNGSSFDGVARGASLISIRVFSLAFCGGFPCAVGWDMDIVDGLERVLELSDTFPIAAVNMSFGGSAFPDPCDSDDPMTTAAITNLRTAGVAPIVASGNDGYTDMISSPACISTAISVGATSDTTDQITSFSNAAYFLSLLAPGSLITSSVPGGGFRSFSGTSMATPHVAGAWAVKKQANPDASVDEILTELQNTGKPIPDVSVTASRIAFAALQFDAAAYSVPESAGEVTVTVTRSGAMFGPNLAPLTVQYATSAGTAIPGQDYVDTSGTLEFAEGETSKTFTVLVNDDTMPSGPRTVNLTLTNPGGGALLGLPGAAVLTIGDDDVALQFSQASYSVKESTASAMITVTRTGPKEPEVFVTYDVLEGSATPGADYGGIYTDVLRFAPDETSKTFTVTIVNDTLAEGAETVLLRLSNPTNGAVLGLQKTAVLAITDNDPAGSFRFGAASYSVNEGLPTITVTVTRTGGKGAVDLEYLLDPAGPGTASEGVDFAMPAPPHTLEFQAQKSLTFSIAILPDGDPEPNETIRLKLRDPVSGATLGQTTITIVDDDRLGTLQFSAANYTVNEASLSATLTVLRSGSTTGTATVELEDVSATGGTCGPGATDYGGALQTLAAGVVSQPVTVPICPDGELEGPQIFKARLTNLPAGFVLGANGEATVTIVDATVQFSAPQYVTGEGGKSVSLLVTRTGSTAAPASVSYSTTPGSAEEAPGACASGFDYRRVVDGVVAFAAGQASKTVSISLCKDSDPGQGDETFSVTLGPPLTGGLALGSPATAEVVIQEDDGIFRLTAAQYSAKEGSASVPVKVQRTGAASGPVSVELVAEESGSAAGGAACAPGLDFVASTQTVTFAPSQSSKTVTVTVPLCGDVLAEGAETFTVRLQNPQGGPALGAPHQAAVSLVSDDVAGKVQFAALAQAVGEDQAEAVITLTRTGGAAGGVKVRVTTHDGSAQAGIDYEAVDTVVTFDADDDTRTVTVPLTPNGSADGTRSLTLQLDLPLPPGQTTLGAPATMTLWILDDD